MGEDYNVVKWKGWMKLEKKRKRFWLNESESEIRNRNYRESKRVVKIGA